MLTPQPIPEFCDVALPVPLHSTFTYRLNGMEPVIGGRVLVPFGRERLAGVVVRLHGQPPPVPAKNVLRVLDEEAALDEGLMKLAEWIADYYLAPVGEVLRTMLPLQAEVKRIWEYRIAPAGEAALHDSAQQGSSRRSRQPAEHQMTEYAVLNFLAGHRVPNPAATGGGEEAADVGGPVRKTALRSATGAGQEVLRGMLRKKWITREDVSTVRDARRMRKIAVLLPQPNPPPRLNQNQKTIIEKLQESGGRLAVDELRGLPVPASTLQTLVRKGVAELILEPTASSTGGDEGPETRARVHAPLGFIFNAEQKSALAAILASVASQKFSVALLHGVTGSGKTAVYLAAMQQVMATGRTALMLVPEIGLTPAAAADLHHVFGEQVAILHSALSADERAGQWRRIRSGAARVVVGTRSAIFAPLPDLALIVVDEEHDTSYKQEETPRYHGRDVAVMRGKLGNCTVLLGSATPSLESYHNTLPVNGRRKYALIELRERVERRPLPEVSIVDMKAEFQRTGREQIFSQKLLEELAGRLALGEQAMVLLNRRGYSALLLCRTCGHTLECVNCAIALTYHKASNRLLCHYCGYVRPVPGVCPECGSEYVHFVGTGSEKLEEALRAALPQARIARLDRDTVRGRHHFAGVINQLHEGSIDILVGTQMIAKGHDVHGVTLVGVVGADFALGFPDFRAAERTFQLLTQVAGRAGRGATPGKVVLQTYFPDHYAIQFAAHHDYPGFRDKELRYRRWMHYPPYTALATVLVRSDKLEHALKFAGILGRWFERPANAPDDGPQPAMPDAKLEGVRVLGPAAAPIVRLKRDYRYHFVLKSASRRKLNDALRAMLDYAVAQKIPRTNVIVDVDAVSLL